jgi:hypothetical protein
MQSMNPTMPFGVSLCHRQRPSPEMERNLALANLRRRRPGRLACQLDFINPISAERIAAAGP